MTKSNCGRINKTRRPYPIIVPMMLLFVVLLIALPLGMTAVRAAGNLNSPSLAPPVLERDFLIAALGGNLSGMVDLMKSRQASDEPLDTEIKTRFQQRFLGAELESQPSSGDPYIDQLISAYHRYWANGLLRTLPPESAERELRAELNGLLTGGGMAAPAEVYAAVATAVRNRGFHLLQDFKAPLRDLYLWREQERRIYRVELTDGEEVVPVVFMHDMLSRGWPEFASLGLQATSGWASPRELHCVEGAYDLKSERFRVSYLKHEARHFADYRIFPGLSERELEYRAKLTELAFAWTSATHLMRRFSESADEHSGSAHAQASHQAIRAVYQEITGDVLPAGFSDWNRLGADRVNPAARRVLERDTEARLGSR